MDEIKPYLNCDAVAYLGLAEGRGGSWGPTPEKLLIKETLR